MGYPDVNWKELLKDKRLWIGGGVAAALGLVVYVRRGAGGSGTPSGADAATGTPVGSAGYVQGGADTTGTDIASFLSSYQNSLTGQLGEFSGNLNDTLKAIQEGAAGGQTTPSVGANPTPKAPFQYYDVQKGDTLLSIADRFKDNGLTYDYLYKINPEVQSRPSLSGVKTIRLAQDGA